MIFTCLDLYLSPALVGFRGSCLGAGGCSGLLLCTSHEASRAVQVLLGCRETIIHVSIAGSQLKVTNGSQNLCKFPFINISGAPPLPAGVWAQLGHAFPT